MNTRSYRKVVKQMSIGATTTKSQALSHINSLMVEALVGRGKDRARFSTLHSRYQAICRLEGETVQELYDRVGASIERSQRTSQLLDAVGIAGLLCLIIAMLLAAHAPIGVAVGAGAAGVFAFLAGGFGSAMAGASVEELDQRMEHLDWLCLSPHSA
jgi:hypothetical protein